MNRVLTIALLAAFAAAPLAAAHAADLDAPYPGAGPYPGGGYPGGGYSGGPAASYGGPYQRAVGLPVPPSVLEEGLAVPPRPLPPVGGPYLYAPGLNGPYGPPVYPFLPFAFGYGY